jgi:hypothetical protein
MLGILGAEQVTEISGLDVLNQVDQFYSSAMDRLLWIIGTAAGVVIIVIPIILTVIQSRMLERERKGLLRETKQEALAAMEVRIQEIIEEQSERHEKALSQVQENMDAEIAGVEALSYHLQGAIYLRDGQSGEALLNFVNAARGQLRGKKYARLRRVLGYIVNDVMKIADAKDYKDCTGLESALYELVTELEEDDHSREYAKERNRIVEWLKEADQVPGGD